MGRSGSGVAGGFLLGAISGNLVLDGKVDAGGGLFLGAVAFDQLFAVGRLAEGELVVLVLQIEVFFFEAFQAGADLGDGFGCRRAGRHHAGKGVGNAQQRGVAGAAGFGIEVLRFDQLTKAVPRGGQGEADGAQGFAERCQGQFRALGVAVKVGVIAAQFAAQRFDAAGRVDDGGAGFDAGVFEVIKRETLQGCLQIAIRGDLGQRGADVVGRHGLDIAQGGHIAANGAAQVGHLQGLEDGALQVGGVALQGLLIGELAVVAATQGLGVASLVHVGGALGHVAALEDPLADVRLPKRPAVDAAACIHKAFALRAGLQAGHEAGECGAAAKAGQQLGDGGGGGVGDSAHNVGRDFAAARSLAFEDAAIGPDVVTAARPAFAAFHALGHDVGGDDGGGDRAGCARQFGGGVEAGVGGHGRHAAARAPGAQAVGKAAGE